MRWLFILTTAALLISLSKITQAQEAKTLNSHVIETSAAVYPNHIEITVKISAHEDLKIAQDKQIAKGQIIRDRLLKKTKLKDQ